jgi:predicted Ser/Thr protein kinase
MTVDVSMLELEELFHSAVAMPAGERTRFLARTCPQTALRAQLERMIEADAHAGGMLDGDRPGGAPSIECATSIGRWNLIERIGAGGLGVVYRASCECDGVTLHAAVKILRPGHNVLLHDSFIQERNILAGIDHPYIARLIDAGAGVCGTSFLAMEFVEGAPLDAHLDQRQPAPGDRLRLFTRICEAVGYLHEHGIVHGDLKPSNVIVRGDGTPKLLDFGTARLIDPDREACESWTRLMMTPAYASPEQMSGLGPSAAGDVYSLGCMLRELLEDRTIQGDLAAILGKCLAARPDERYGSAREVAQDIDNHLNHRPVRAHAASSAYVVSKFIRRNLIASGLTAVVAASGTIGGLASRHQAMLAQRYSDQHRAVVAHLVRDDSPKRAPDTQQRAAYVGGVEDAIAQMERMNPPPLADLACAWRRLSYSQADRGETAEAIASVERSIEWARRYKDGQGTPDAGRQLAESLLQAALLQQRRGRISTATEFAVEAVHLTDTLPPSSRTTVERTPQFIRGLWLTARRGARDGDVEAGRALLKRSIELSRAMGKTAQLRSTLDLVWLERAVQDEPRAAAACGDARSLGIATARLVKLCGPGPGAGSLDREDTVARESAIFERQLQFDPERYRYRLQLARRKLQLARFAEEKQDRLRARELVQEARALAQDLLKADAENQTLQILMARIDRVSMRIAAH